MTCSTHQCRWCGDWHGSLCQAVKAIEYHPDGSVKRVEFRDPIGTLFSFAPVERPSTVPFTTTTYPPLNQWGVTGGMSEGGIG